MRKLALCAALGTALLCSATTTPAYAFHDPGGASATTVHYGTAIGDINQARGPTDDNVGRDSETFNIDMLGDINDSAVTGGAATRSVATTTSLVDDSSDTR